MVSHNAALVVGCIERARAAQDLLRRCLLLLLMASLTEACRGVHQEQGGPFVLPKNAPVRKLTFTQRNLVFEDPGTIAVFHGQSCTQNDEGGDPTFVEESLDLPSYAAKATVFLNGWRLRYLDDDHNVSTLLAGIDSIRQEGTTLKWRASGEITDNSDTPYNWCYNHTVVAWNPANVNVSVDQADALFDGNPTLFGIGNRSFATADTSFSSFISNPELSPGRAAAILPRGFVTSFGICFFCFPPGHSDFNLAQVAFNLDSSEIFIDSDHKRYHSRNGEEPSFPGGASQVDSGFVSWETTGVFKDDDDKRDYFLGEMVSALGGADVGLIQPPFTILPEPTSSAVGSSKETKEIIVDNVPFEYAIPMLVGWNLFYPEGDKNVGEIGTSIDEFHYREPADPPGRLRYKLSSVMTDNESATVAFFRQKVSILGIKPVARGGTPSQRVADLVPFSPGGTGPASFCRLEQQATKLRVTVKNQGNEQAASSKTTVLFGTFPVTLDTPPVPAGGTVDLLFAVPPGCFSPDCSFTIRVDASNQVSELNEANNLVNGGCVG